MRRSDRERKMVVEITNMGIIAVFFFCFFLFFFVGSNDYSRISK